MKLKGMEFLDLSFNLTRFFATAMASRKKTFFMGVESAILISMADANFSHTRGTLPKRVGDTSRRFMARVSGLSTKLTVSPAWMPMNTELRFSMTWEKGR